MAARRFYPDICQNESASEFVGIKVAVLEQCSRFLEPGGRIVGIYGRTATYLGNHPDPDYLGADWWRIAFPAREVD